jgi:hypothetical protein
VKDDSLFVGCLEGLIGVFSSCFNCTGVHKLGDANYDLITAGFEKMKDNKQAPVDMELRVIPAEVPEEFKRYCRALSHQRLYADRHAQTLVWVKERFDATQDMMSEIKRI